MRHRKAGRKLGRTSAHREAMLRNLVCNLFEHGRIQTTVPKAKEARRLAEKAITAAKRGVAAFAAVEAELPALKTEGSKLREQLEKAGSDDEKRNLQKAIERNGKKISGLNAKGMHYRRLALRDLHQRRIVRKLFEELAPRYADRPGGYTRVLKAGFRKGDNASIALFELV
ncbi:MAG: bL17 family ribosomal protein [Planctomycetota bacterium]|jgi:large subunit ribosomal protein L17|nr:bL17 family ribosomal protein [Planctomycetota bacterium]